MQRRPEQLEVEIPRQLTVRQLAELLRVQSADVVKVLLSNGVLATVSQQVDYDTAALAACALGFRPRKAPAR